MAALSVACDSELDDRVWEWIEENQKSSNTHLLHRAGFIFFEGSGERGEV